MERGRVREDILSAGRESVPMNLATPAEPAGWVVIGRQPDPARQPSIDRTVARLSLANLATLVVDLPAADARTLAGWVQLAATHLRADVEVDGRLPIAYFGAGAASAAGWIAAAGGAVDGVMAWNARPFGAWPYLPSVTVPSLLVADHSSSLLVAHATKWQLGTRADIVAGPPAGDLGVLVRWYHDRLLAQQAPARWSPRPAGARARVASMGVAAALVATPAGAFAAAVAARPAAAAPAGLPDFSSGARLTAAQIGGDNQAGAMHASLAPAGPHRLTAADIGGDGAKAAHDDPPLVDGIGVRWHINTNIGFSTSSSASGAASEAEFIAPVAATTLNGGTVNMALNDAFDGYNALCVDVNNVGGQCNTASMAVYNKNGPSSLECSGRQVVLPPKVIGTLSVSRKVFVPTNDGFIRWLDIVTNTSASTQTVRLQTSNNLGSDAATRIVTTSDGDATPELTDTWVTTFQNYSGTTSSDVRLGHVLRGSGAPVGLAALSFVNGDDNPYWRYVFDLPAGQTGIIMNFATGQASKAAAATESAALASMSNANALVCMSTAEKAAVRNFALVATPTITTQASAGGPVGTSLTDTATVSGGAGPTGTVTFRLFSDAACTSQVFASTNNLVAGSATSGSFTPAAPGAYYWTAVYNGDANNNTATSGCNAPNESAVITRASPTITTQASAGGPVGTSLTDTATVSGGAGPTGTVTFRLFSDAACTSQVFASTNNLVAGSATSGSFTPAAPGTYYWTAVYNGDANNNTAISGCNAPNESATITPFAPPACTRTLTGDVTGPIVVSSGESVCINNARVLGPITVSAGGALTVNASQVANGIVATSPAFLSVCGTAVSAPSGNPAQGVVVQNATVPLRLGDPANGCATNRVAGDVTLTGNTSGLTFGSNIVSRNVTVNNNAGTTVIKANQIFGTLACSGNNPPPTNAGQTNTAASKTGQCAGL